MFIEADPVWRELVTARRQRQSLALPCFCSGYASPARRDPLSRATRRLTQILQPCRMIILTLRGSAGRGSDSRRVMGRARLVETVAIKRGVDTPELAGLRLGSEQFLSSCLSLAHYWHTFGGMAPSVVMQPSTVNCFFMCDLEWSHPPGLNRRPADYETFRSTQIAENTVHRPSFAPAIKRVVAQVEQVSEQVAAPIPFPNTTTAEVEQARRPTDWEGIQIKRTVVSRISSIRPRAPRGES
jgi:hypothetical protein